MAKGKIITPSFICVGGSAGSLQVVLRILQASARPDQTIPVLVVLHREPQGGSRLTELLSLRTGRKIKEVEDKDVIEPGWVYVCPADYHVLIEADNSFSLDYSEKEHFSRPSIDVAFRAAADVYRDKLICILLSGANSDGAEGLKYAQELGALTIIQEPGDASVSYMPEQAMQLQQADYIMTKEEMREFLKKY